MKVYTAKRLDTPYDEQLRTYLTLAVMKKYVMADYNVSQSIVDTLEERFVNRIRLLVTNELGIVIAFQELKVITE
jgi:hypothetical protein